MNYLLILICLITKMKNLRIKERNIQGEREREKEKRSK
jgi:hypothetical protein